jgi:hypothetical protein
MRTLPLIAALALLAGAPTAQAAGWSHPQGFDAGTAEFDEPVARVAVAADGTSVATFAKGGTLYAVTGDRRGRFSSPQRLGRWAAITSVVAAGRGGSALAAWEARDGIRIAVRARSGRRLRVRLLTGSNGQAINDLALRNDPRGGWFLLETQFSRTTHKNSVRAFTLRADGRLALAPQTLGEGSFGAEARPVRALAVDDRGGATTVFGSERGPMAARAVHAGHFGALQPLGGTGFTDARVAASSASEGPLVAMTKVETCGDVGCFGAPFAARLTAEGVPVPFQVPALEHPNRAFGPSIAPLGTGAAALVFSLKTGPDPFGKQAPVKAVVLRDGAAPGSLQTLTSKPATEPIAAALSGGRVLVLWSGARGFGAALAGRDGRFRSTAEPPGPPPAPFHTNPTNREISTAGPYALVGWSRAGRVRLSLRRL